METLKIIVVDDEPLARKRMTRLLNKCHCEVVAELEDASALVEYLEREEAPDAIFLDIEMPGGTGMEAMAELPKAIPVVFVTAHEQHAVRAFEADAVDYILKPIFEPRLQKALEKVRLHIAKQSPPATPSAGNPILPAGVAGRFPARAGGGHLFLEFKRVSHFELEGQAVYAWCAGKRFRSPWDTIAEVEETFPNAGMIRIQRHLLLRPEAVIGHRSLPKGRAKVRVSEGVELEVSRSVTPRLRELLGLSRNKSEE
jgi:DNA-binding LytR/AlgR family response regulator